jgi:predicted metal-dependent TIM-barrel fold hydrolase
MEEKFKKIEKLAHKHKWSIYFDGRHYNVTTYAKIGKHPKEISNDLNEALDRMIEKLK